jgi:hypothetical protein
MGRKEIGMIRDGVFYVRLIMKQWIIFLSFVLLLIYFGNKYCSWLVRKNQWDKDSLVKCFEHWCHNNSVASHKALPCFVLWGIWLARNKALFQGIETGQVAHQIKSAYGERWKISTPKATRILIEPVIDYSVTQGYFDGACQGIPGNCGSHLHFVSVNFSLY